MTTDTTHALPTGSRASWRRTHTCGELRSSHIGSTVTLNGWVAGRRDHGGIYFVDLRDRYGVTQVTLASELSDRTQFSTEWVVAITGEVVAREPGNANPDLPTGDIEVRVKELVVLSQATVPPFEVEDGIETAVEIRLRHRHVDLRRPEMTRNLIHRSRFIGAMRRGFEAQDFVEVETPILTKATPEGARDYLVPSRVHPGEFYALPQSPQIFKQILMVSGLDRYFQVARCFRDEDLRADRQPEFTQLDMEMSFVAEDDVFEAWEKVMASVFDEVMGIQLKTPFARLTWREAMDRFGSDKPDLRYGLELTDLAEWVPLSGFKVFEGALAQKNGRVMAICVPGGGSAISRGQMKTLESRAKELGAQGLAWWKPGESGGGAGPVARFCEGDSGADLLARLGGGEGDLVLFCAGEQRLVWKVLGALRTDCARRLELIPKGHTTAEHYRFAWVVDFPMYEWDEETGAFMSAHHPFTAPVDPTLSGDQGELMSRAYDLVLNGWELGSGSIRIHDQKLQARIFDQLGISPDEARTKFGFLLDALGSGAPPHGGFAMGLDRVVALTLGLEGIRDVIAFPKTTSATDLMCGAPSVVPDRQLAEVHVARAGRGRTADGGSTTATESPTGA
jgi:aspartyl-tRNA synthetase